MIGPDAAAPEFGASLLASLPGSVIEGLRLPGSLFGREALRDAVLPAELRAAIALVAEAAEARSVPLQFVARPEIYTHGRARAWLDDRIGGARDHVVITDGRTLRTLPGLRNHLFFYPRGVPAREAALRRLVGIVPELFGGLASQINGGLAFRCGGAWHRPPPTHLRLPTTPPLGRVERFPFNGGAAAPPEARLAEGPAEGPVRYVPLSGTALADAAFLRELAREMQGALFGGPGRLMLELPRLDGVPDTAGRLAAAARALSRAPVPPSRRAPPGRWSWSPPRRPGFG
ncbi:hypothetical protein EAH89_07500 [Roseomonas nepalensis]|uniref:Uncharacterized protein n=1 Tax=Muricoccus nepalensis TaxID=1854500 RepID=A0A502GCG1_9PROT|nr:hypothetical protein [Roseomonas nepalensis]TPG59178.1 hypothetical protein EAH89_07500 [Roseomonas nepalensis]